LRLAALITVIGCFLSLPAPVGASPFDDIGKAVEKAVQDTGKAAQKAADDAAKASQQAGQQVRAELIEKALAAQATEKVLAHLKTLSLDTLYALKVSPDICAAGTVNCEVLPNERVRQLLDVELDRRKAALDYEDKNRSFLISSGSLIVSFCAFGLSVFGLFRNRGAPVGA
jgi:hypothetical protein